MQLALLTEEHAYIERALGSLSDLSLAGCWMYRHSPGNLFRVLHTSGKVLEIEISHKLPEQHTYKLIKEHASLFSNLESLVSRLVC